jgi:UDP-N-acetylmuramoyl-tripeptide--D-alanyl-D-alanine ligase
VIALAAVLLVLAVGALLAGRLHVLLHMLQQEHYENARLLVWIRLDRTRWAPSAATAALVAGILVAAAAAIEGWLAAAIAGLMLVNRVWWARTVWHRTTIKPLVFTPRARRLFAVALVLGLVPTALVAALVPGDVLRFVIAGVVAAGTLAVSPWLLFAANRILAPFQRMETQRFVRAARARLEQVHPTVVGVSGSFGKTTTKACLAAALDPIGPTYPTPASFNSYLGVVRAINEGLEPVHENFIVELGAYRIGDIAAICDLVHPSIGVLCSLGPAHLERFGSMDAIEQAEGELADALPPDGLFVTQADDERCLRVARTRAHCRTLLFSAQEHPEADLWAEDAEVTAGGTAFTIVWRDPTIEPVRVKSRLLGSHNVANLLAAAAVAHHAGLTPPQIARALRRVTPPKHRLEPIVNAAAGIVVIDDSYNSNPVGAAAALQVLGAHEAQRRILVTPGMVELGAEEQAENRLLGERAAAVVDLALLTGPRAADIRDGMLAAGFDANAIVIAADGPATHAKVAEIGRRGDVFLFENDIPDVYA